ncbi:MAG: hypothetical protein QM811_09220 [Pirellulales bacterium]
MRTARISLLLCWLVWGCSTIVTAADDAPAAKPTLDRQALRARIEKVVIKHYPKAKCELQDDVIHFEFDGARVLDS